LERGFGGIFACAVRTFFKKGSPPRAFLKPLGLWMPRENMKCMNNSSGQVIEIGK